MFTLSLSEYTQEYEHQRFLCKDTSISAFSGRILECSTLMVSPAVENTLSEGAEDAWAHKYFCATSYRSGKVSLFCHLHRMGSDEMGIAGRPLCFLKCVKLANESLPAALKMPT